MTTMNLWICEKSSFISNSVKLDYWVDEEYTNTVGYYKGFTFSEDFFKPVITIPQSGKVVTYGEVFNVGSNITSINAISTKSKAERITFIPPKSSIFKHTLHLSDYTHIKYREDVFDEKVVPASYADGKTTKVRVAELEGNNVFLKFRNFLTLSTSENFTNEFYVDNAFNVKTITMMKTNQFRGKYTMQNDYEYPYRKASNFYYEYPEE